MSMGSFVDSDLLASLAAAEATLEETAREDLLAFALGQHRDKAEIVDLSDWIHTAVAGKKAKSIEVDEETGERLDSHVWARPPMLTLLVPAEVVAQVHGDPKLRDCMLLVHIKREVLDSWLAQKELSAGVQ